MTYEQFWLLRTSKCYRNLFFYRLKHYKWDIVIVKLRVLVHWTTIKLYLPQQTLVGESNIGLGVQAFRSRVLEKKLCKNIYKLCKLCKFRMCSQPCSKAKWRINWINRHFLTTTNIICYTDKTRFNKRKNIPKARILFLVLTVSKSNLVKYLSSQ